MICARLLYTQTIAFLMYSTAMWQPAYCYTATGVWNLGNFNIGIEIPSVCHYIDFHIIVLWQTFSSNCHHRHVSHTHIRQQSLYRLLHVILFHCYGDSLVYINHNANANRKSKLSNFPAIDFMLVGVMNALYLCKTFCTSIPFQVKTWMRYSHVKCILQDPPIAVHSILLTCTPEICACNSQHLPNASHSIALPLAHSPVTGLALLCFYYVNSFW